MPPSPASCSISNRPATSSPGCMGRVSPGGGATGTCQPSAGGAPSLHVANRPVARALVRGEVHRPPPPAGDGDGPPGLPAAGASDTLRGPVVDGGLPLVAELAAPPHEVMGAAGHVAGREAAVPGGVPLGGDPRLDDGEGVGHR